MCTYQSIWWLSRAFWCVKSNRICLCWNRNNNYSDMFPLYLDVFLSCVLSANDFVSMYTNSAGICIFLILCVSWRVSSMSSDPLYGKNSMYIRGAFDLCAALRVTKKILSLKKLSYAVQEVVYTFFWDVRYVKKDVIKNWFLQWQLVLCNSFFKTFSILHEFSIIMVSGRVGTPSTRFFANFDSPYSKTVLSLSSLSFITPISLLLSEFRSFITHVESERDWQQSIQFLRK